MDYSLIIFIIVVAIFSFSGYRKGIIVVALRLASLLIAYLFSWLFAKPVGGWLQSVLPLEGLVVYALAGVLIFIITSTLLSIVFGVVSKTLLSSEEVSSVSAVGGGLLGAGVGVLVGFFAVWFFSTFQTLIQMRSNETPKMPTQFETSVKSLAGGTVKTITSAISEQDEISSATAALLSNPAENIERINRISNSGNLQRMLNDGAARGALNAMNPSALAKLPAFKKLVTQREFVELAQAMNLVSDPAELEKEVAYKITKLWAQIKQVQNDPEYIKIVQDPEVREMLTSRNIYRMISSEKIEKLLQVIAAVEVPDSAFASDTLKPEEVPEIHRWVDDEGRVHYSDKKNNEN